MMGGASSKTHQTPPDTMQRLVLTHPAADIEKAILTLETLPVPKPRSGEVLIRVAAAPVNPSDYEKWRKEIAPGAKWREVPMGNEGSGVVVASGGGIWANSMVGYNVGFFNLKKQGSYSEYVTAGFTSVSTMPTTLPVEDAASFFVNPYTAYAIVDTASRRGGKGFVHTGAASQVGQMIIKYMVSNSIDLNLVNVVRREEQAEVLRALGAKHIVITSGDEAKWRKELKELITRLDISLAFDCVAGAMTEILIDALPNAGTTFVYGKLSGESARVAPIDMIYFGKKMEGFLLAGYGDHCWLNLSSPLSFVFKQYYASKAVNSGLGADGWAATQFLDCNLDNMFTKFLEMRSSGFTNNKLRIRMS